ncbi:calcineurin-like phosphoesterase [Lasallia pustulata]|uniref:Endopolyphosphatase n=1 Tax=Lasallia pustulata TaxID=136370 RepID=A0A1W5D372_9LECA|nr:calcineurin-like phosphoesterase [Lasallia pustulata]
MHKLALAVPLLAVGFAHAVPAVQQPLIPTNGEEIVRGDWSTATASRKLQGKFLHITDFHLDPFYKYHSSTEEEAACHRDEGPAGILGAETTDCDAPLSLINATFRWIDENLKDDIDFIIWTGDSARHDNDEEIPRSEAQVVQLNELLVHKFVEVFGKQDNINDTDPTNDLTIPIIPTFGNNDILPHNILASGPNEWTKKFSSIWRKFIPEEQRHGFERGGGFYVEVIPNQLAVFSLNTLYFFDSNTAVDGCAEKSEPGYEHMEWLRIQLEFLRQKGMKAIMTGHVPPARTESKTSWDETCWQKYTLWMRQYRDVVVGSVYGHMNIDHFLLQDIDEVNTDALNGDMDEDAVFREAFDDELTIQSSTEYLSELRIEWSHLPDPEKIKLLLTVGLDDESQYRGLAGRKEKGKDKKQREFFRKIGGRWGERYSSALISPSIVPNYFPTMRVIEYNITGIDDLNSVTDNSDLVAGIQRTMARDGIFDSDNDEHVANSVDSQETDLEELAKGKKKKSRNKYKKLKKPNFTVPNPPSKSAPPGPAYSPQTLTWLSYTQYFANLTKINNDFVSEHGGDIDDTRWKKGKHHGKHPKEKGSKPHPKPFVFEVEYDTRNDSIYKMKDLTVMSYIDLAARIGRYRPEKGDRIQDTVSNGLNDDRKDEGSPDNDSTGSFTATKKGGKKGGKKGKKHGKHHKRKAINKVWFTFVKRAFVGTRDDADLHEQFGQPVQDCETD